MNVRDREIDRLVKYAEGLGIRVAFKEGGKGCDGASWDTEGNLIEIFTTKKLSKIQLILNFVHELAHHMSWVHSGRVKDHAIDAALDAEEDRRKGDPPIPRKQRRLIYLSEQKDAHYRDRIIKEVGLKIPKYMAAADLAVDLWMYKRYYITGDFPFIYEIKKRHRELKREYRRAIGTKATV